MSEKVVRVVPHNKGSAAWNLAVEEALFETAVAKMKQSISVQPIVHLYSFDKPTVVLGYNQKISEINFPYCQQQRVHVTMRKTGGGSVFLSEEEMQYGLILPEKYNHQLLSRINKMLVEGFSDIGIQAQLVEKDGHDIIRYKKKGFVFDAQKRVLINNGLGGYNHVFLHHGTILIDDENYDHMPAALRADSSDLNVLKNGNIWLRQKEQLKAQELIKSLNRNLSQVGVKTVVKDLTSEEYALAQKLYHEYYSRSEQWMDGTKEFGICYRTDIGYDMESYAESEKIEREVAQSQNE